MTETMNKENKAWESEYGIGNMGRVGGRSGGENDGLIISKNKN